MIHLWYLPLGISGGEKILVTPLIRVETSLVRAESNRSCNSPFCQVQVCPHWTIPLFLAVILMGCGGPLDDLW